MAQKSTSAGKKTPLQGGRLTEDTDPQLDRAVRDKLITARIRLLLRAPFFGNLATRLHLTNADSWLSTAATDGRHFYYNTEFCNRLTERELEFLFGHEVLHNVYDHMDRVGDFRDRQLFNCAADFAVNLDLVEHKIGQKIDPCLYDTKYKGWSAEKIYDELYNNAEKIDIKDLLDLVLDEHLDNDDEEGDGGSEGEVKDKGKGKPKLTAEERREIRDEIRQAVLQAAQTCSAGDIPGNVRRMISDITSPVVNWRELLQQQIQSIIKNDFTFLRPSRRSWHMDAILPGMLPGTQIDICIAIDTSGSIGNDDIKAFLSEIKGIMESYTEYNIQIWSFDTQVYNHKVFTSDNMEEIENYEPMGGGGTSFEINWTYMRENNIEPKKFIMFTDGCPFGGWGDPDYCDTVFVIKGNERATPPFGVWAIYEHAAEMAGQ